MMNESFRLGRIAGVAVGVNWSVLVIFALISGGLYVGLPDIMTEFGFEPAAPAANAIAALTTAVVFFLSLLAHEVAHAIVAMRNGIEVEAITLWLFGGVAKLGGEAHDPGSDLRIAGVGPLVSLGLAGLFGALAVFSVAVGLPPLILVTIAWLSVINVVLAVFNLFPAAPLDGGRILRAYLWWRRGDRISASITASRAGRVFGFVLVAVGLVWFALTADFGGLWFVLIGWFLISAAGAEEQHARLRGAIGGLRVGDVMTPDPTSVPPLTSLDAFIEDYVFGHRYSTYPLVDDFGQPVGLVTLNRVRSVPREARASTRVADIACSRDEIALATPDEGLLQVLPRMRGCGDGRVLVVLDGRLVGILSPTDVARLLETAELRDHLDGQRL